VLQLRAAKSMLLDPSDPNGHSCGSFFVNPVLGAEAFAALCSRAAPALPPSHAEADGKVKVPAAWLIQHSGFERGHRTGNVGLSSKHTLCVVAHPGATSAEVLDLARQIQAAVQIRFGIRLEPEPQLLALRF
jgi:UDP-N-acetylmuramate dehydrogenase